MKNNITEYLGFEDDEVRKVGRPKLADKETKKKSLIIAGLSFFIVILLLVFGYGNLVGFKNFNLLASLNNDTNANENILVTDITPLIKDITIKENTARKLYLKVLPASATNKNIKYESKNENVATIDKNGKVTAIKEGNTTIKAYTTDGSNKEAEFNIKVIKDSTGYCTFTQLNKTSTGINYEADCNNAKIKEIQYKVDNGNYEKLLTKKLSDSVKFSKEQLNKKITFKIVYYPNNSKISKYKTRTINNIPTTKKINGSCNLTIKEVNKNSAKYDITCNNASVSKIAYKIGNGSYVGIDPSSLADTIIFEESDVTRVIYFNVEYIIDGNNKIKTITESTIIEKKVSDELKVQNEE